MVTYSRLAELAAEGDGWVVIDTSGRILEVDLPGDDIAPATLLVSPVTDALKRISDEGMVVESLDRDEVWTVAAFALSHAALSRLDGDYSSPLDLYHSVTAAGFGWQLASLAARVL